MLKEEVLNEAYNQFTVRDKVIVDVKMYEARIEAALSDFDLVDEDDYTFKLLPITEDKKTSTKEKPLPRIFKEKMYFKSNEEAKKLLPLLEERVNSTAMKYIKRIIEPKIRKTIYENIRKNRYKDYENIEAIVREAVEQALNEYRSEFLQTKHTIRYCDDLTIKSTATMIDKNVFAGKGLKRVILDDKISIISPGAFANNEITSITLPKHLGVIGDEAFAHNKLRIVEIPASITSIKKGAFSDNQITALKFAPNSKLTYIGEEAFSNNPIEKVTLPREITKVKDRAFDEKTEMILPKGVILLPNDPVKGRSR